MRRKLLLKLYEYEAKRILKKYGIPIPKGVLVTWDNLAGAKFSRIKPPYAIKSQVLVAGRGNAGGILFASSAEKAQKEAKRLLKKEIKGYPVRKVLVEELISIKKELYCGISIDRFLRSHVFLSSSVGGVDIERTSAKIPKAIAKNLIASQQGFHSFHARQIARRIGYRGSSLVDLARIFKKLYKAGMDYDAELIEINPLVETSEGAFIALDAHIIIDDNAIFRHQKYKQRLLREAEGQTPQEISALKNDLAYVKMKGNIGVIGNGAGLVMATLDLIHYYGGKPADFLDVGGGAPAKKILKATEIVLSDPNVKALLVNILGGITRCDEVARGIIKARDKGAIMKPIVVRLVGNKETEGKKILSENGIIAFESMEEAALQIVEVAKREGYGYTDK
jgi:succinyl-CoA synthetase beta subunit